jgi:hypothetical protein
VLEYVKEAFWFRPRIPGLGQVPINIMACLVMLILGYAHPGFWLLGLALETAYLYVLAANPGFRRWVDIKNRMRMEGDDEEKRGRLIRSLSAAGRKRYKELEAKCVKILNLIVTSDADPDDIGSNRMALKELLWVYLKLLIARNNLNKADSSTTAPAIEMEIRSLESQLSRDNLREKIREAKQATLYMLKKRLKNVERRGHYLEEIESNLKRIETRIDLAFDNVSMKNLPDFVSTDIEIADSMLKDFYYDDSEDIVLDLETRISQDRASVKRRERALQ